MDTAQQLVENNITLFFIPGGHLFKQFLEQSSIPEYNKLAETMIITKEKIQKKIPIFGGWLKFYFCFSKLQFESRKSHLTCQRTWRQTSKKVFHNWGWVGWSN